MSDDISIRIRRLPIKSKMGKPVMGRTVAMEAADEIDKLRKDLAAVEAKRAFLAYRLGEAERMLGLALYDNGIVAVGKETPPAFNKLLDYLCESETESEKVAP